MTAWVRFINKTKRQVLYAAPEGKLLPVPLIFNLPSHRVLVSAGTLTLEIFDSHHRKLSVSAVSVPPNTMLDIFLY